MNLLAVALVFGAVAILGLGYVRIKSGSGELGRSTDIVALVASFAGGIAAALLVAAAVPAGNPSNTYLGAATHGATLGALVFVCTRLLIFDLTAWLWHWCRRVPHEMTRKTSEYLTTSALTLIGFAAAFAAFFVALHLVAGYDIAAWFALALFFALIPLYETFAVPWFRYARAPTLASVRLSELETWVETVGMKHRLPRVRIRIQDGTYQNAFAIGGLSAHLIILGKGLLDDLSFAQLKAVVAHEVAHVIRRDVRRSIPPMLLATSLHMLFAVAICRPTFEVGSFWLMLCGAALLGATGTSLQMLIPGYMMRRREFAADKLAVQLLGDGETLVEALRRLCSISGRRLTQGSWSHPSIQSRIDAIRSLATAS